MDPTKTEEYLSRLLKQPIAVHALTPLGSQPVETGNKAYGYGTPIRIDYELADGRQQCAVLHTVGAGSFGHEHMADRAQILLWQHKAFNQLPRHIHALDAGGFDDAGNLISLGNIGEFCLLTEYAEGQCYACDLTRIQTDGIAREIDFARADALCDYLAEIHRTRAHQPGLYTRRIRELVGHSECIMGLADSYPDHPVITKKVLEEVEHRAVTWRWRLKDRVHRLRTVHGDFHPWNILFQDGTAFSLLDRSRGEFGDPADDVTCLAANYLFFSLQRTGRLEPPFEELFLRFWDRYTEKTGDLELPEVVAPFFAFRCLVMASPVWYPDLSDTVRRKLISFIFAVLDLGVFDPTEVNAYCDG